jgi:osmoprotectant transport system permease protein
MPIGLTLGHIGKGEYFAVGFGNAGRAVPEIAVVFLLAAILGIGLGNVALALGILGLPPILTNTFVAIRQVDPTAVQAAQGMGMRPWQVILRVELPLAAPTIMTGIRTAAINIFATATIASFVGLSTLGDLVTGTNVYGTDGVVAGAIVIAVLAGSIEAVLAGVQWLVTPRGLKLQRATRSA